MSLSISNQNVRNSVEGKPSFKESNGGTESKRTSVRTSILVPRIPLDKDTYAKRKSSYGKELFGMKKKKPWNKNQSFLNFLFFFDHKAKEEKQILSR